MEKSKCAKCMLRNEEKICQNAEGKYPPFCPTEFSPEIVSEAMSEYKKQDVGHFHRQSSIQEAEGYANREEEPYPVKPRLKEIIEFSRRMGYHKLGLAFCSGVQHEAAVVNKILKESGFEVVSVVCDVGGIPKEEVGLDDNDKVKIGSYETICNPIAQAKILNDSGTDFNVLLGLCVGHDSLFFKYSEAMVTVLAAKDRLLGHNPLAAVYTAHSYYTHLNSPLISKEK